MAIPAKPFRISSIVAQTADVEFMFDELYRTLQQLPQGSTQSTQGAQGVPGPTGAAGRDGQSGIPGADGDAASTWSVPPLSLPLTVPNGGTNVSTFAANGVLYGNGTTSVLATSAPAANGLLSSSGGVPTFSATPMVTALTVSGAAAAAAGGISAITYTAGGLVIADGQIVFPAEQAASSDVHALDDYEEGTWTPVLTFTTPGDLSVAYSTQVGSYTRVGNRVMVTFNVITTTFTWTTATGVLQITGLPFTSITVAGGTHLGTMNFQGLTSAVFTQAAPRVASNVALIDFMGSGFAQTTAQLATTNTTSSTQVTLRGSVVYQVAT